ncbi:MULTISPECIES: hypothetical protein [Halorussus]|uniref:hypothetical protein n=1 Tax=Halorussus TaxID=1070314 RepID=UPI0020A21B20|nr:hypothetical protein [Halorussus vallis]USZ78637.1 hypothetical protein NGM07_25140 [Halorussus vallis]USZ78668.1 hypothetical protein NGM07_24470 [Halorussus vallis]
MTARNPAVALAVMLVVASITAVVPATPARAGESESQCSNMVVHDAFRFDNSTVEKARNSSATSTVSNTEVTIEQATGFIRVSAENPNGYCNEFHVRLDKSIVSPAELGSVDSNDGNYSADWHATRDFSRNETYTEVVLTLPAGTKATFAPSELRVKSLSWTGKAESAGSELFGNISLPDFFGSDDLEQRTYDFSPEGANNSTIITVALSNQSDGRSIDEWQASYRTSPDGEWSPVSKESTAPVFYRKTDSEHVQFIFNDANATVEFTANPTFTDKARHSWRSYDFGLDRLKGLVNISNLFWIQPPRSLIA